MIADAETEFSDVLRALEGSRPADLPADLEAKAHAGVAGDGGVTPPWGAFEEHADTVYRALSALTLGDAWLAEHALAEAFARVDAKSEPTLPELLHAGRHAALESLAKTGSASDGLLSHSDRALVFERRLGLSLEALARIWSQTPARLTERLEECGVRLLADLEQRAPSGAARPEAPCPAWRERLPLALLDLLEGADAEAYAKHLAECAACSRWTALLEDTMTPAQKTLPVPENTRQRLKERLEPERCVPVDLGIQVSVSCCYCHDGMARKEAAFCATCLAPHHPDCFQTHGRCATPGCEGIDVVYPTQHTKRRRRSWRWQGIGLVGGLVGVLVGGAAALRLRDAVLLEAQSQASAGEADSEAWALGPLGAPSDRAAAPGGKADPAPVDDRRPLTLLEDPITIAVTAGEHSIPDLANLWAKAHPGIKAFTVDPQLREVNVEIAEPTTLDRENFRALLEARDAVLVVGPSESARVVSRRNLGFSAQDPVLIEGDTPVDPDSYVTRVIPIRYGGGNAIFATVRGLLTRDANRCGNILYTQQGATLTVVDFARKVRAYEEMILRFDRPPEPASVQRARVQVLSVSAHEWANVRGEGDAAVLAWLEGRDGLAKTTLCDYDFESPAQSLPGAVTTIYRRGAYRTPPLQTPALLVNATTEGDGRVTLTLEFGEGLGRLSLRCTLPVPTTRIQSIRLEGQGVGSDTYVVFVVSGR